MLLSHLTLKQAVRHFTSPSSASHSLRELPLLLSPVQLADILALSSTSTNIKLLDASYHVPLRLRTPSTPASLKEKIRMAFGVGASDQLDVEPPHIKKYLEENDDEVPGSLLRDAKREFELGDRIQGSQFFDLSTIRDILKSQPLISPAPEDFAEFMNDLSIKNTDHIIVYDTLGTQTSPRAWSLLRLMGHQNISILDGGLPAWRRANLPVVPTTASSSSSTESPASTDPSDSYTPDFQPTRVRDYQDILRGVVDLMQTNCPVIIDVRPPERHMGMGIEPLHTTKKYGTIPGSINIHWREFLDPSTNTILAPLEIIRVLKAPGRRIDLDRDIVVFGNDAISASVVQLCLEVLGKTEGVSVYEGGWSEWAGQDASPTTRKG
ncbi:hypothetical protein HDU79_002728, partial [Rhizoclosmatium sp. JEL0117]